MGKFIYWLNPFRPDLPLWIRIAASLALGILLLIAGTSLSRSSHWPLVWLGEIIREGGRLFGVIAIATVFADNFQRRLIIREFADTVISETARQVRLTAFQDLPNVVEAGLKGIRPQMDFFALFRELQPGEELLWLDTFTPTVRLWDHDLAQAVKRGATVRMMILHPESMLVDMREREVTVDYESSYKHEIEEFVRCLVKVKNSLKRDGHDLDLLYYRDLLGCPTYIVRREGKPVRAFSSLYLLSATGRSFPHFEWIDQGDASMLHYLDSYVASKLEVAEEIIA